MTISLLRAVICGLILVPTLAVAQTKKPLKEQATFPMGVAVNRKIFQGPKGKYPALIKAEFNSVTAENMMKMKFLQPSEGEFTFKTADSLVDWANANGMRMHGHCLVWHYALPDWVNAYDGQKDKIEAIFKRHIQMTASNFRGKLSSWDVVNEAISDSAGTMRNTIWYRNIGPDYIEKAFRYAREMDGKALLFYNEYGLEWDAAKLKATVALLTSLKKKGVPIDGVGLQMHTHTGQNKEGIQNALRELAALGLQVHISELDVSVNGPADRDGGLLKEAKLPPDMANKQADMYKFVAATYKTYVPRKFQYGITLWNLSDDDSWVPKFGKKIDFPNIFDDKLNRKPAYSGLWSGLQ